MSDIHQILENSTSLNNDKFLNNFQQNHINEVKESMTDDNNSEYEDIDDDDDEDEKFGEINNDDDVHINVKPRRLNKKQQDDEHSEGFEDDDDNQNVPNRKPNTIDNIEKSDKNKKLVDDDNNTQSPAYVPRKGKFYEHDDRTIDENNPIKQDISTNKNRFYKNSDDKWPHDLYFQDEQRSKSRPSISRPIHNHSQYKHNYNPGRFYSNNYLSHSQKGRDDQYYNDYHRRIPNDNYNNRMNIFDFKDNNRSSSYNHNASNKDINTYEKVQTISRPQRRENGLHKINDETFHRRRYFTNRENQQEDNASSFNKTFDQNSRKQLGEDNTCPNHGRKHQQEYRDLKKYDLYDNKINLPPRFQTNDKQNFIQKQQYQHNSVANISTNGLNIERPKRYSDMRNTMTNSAQQQPLSSQLKFYQDQRSNNIEQNDWPQAPPPPTIFIPQQLMTPKMYYQKQTSRYVSLSQQLPENQ